MHQFDMTNDEVREAKWAAKEVARNLDGVKLTDGLEMGEVLMNGRHHAMKAAGINKPQGKAYAEAFREWKQAFKFREGKEAENYYDAAIVCAQHRTIANEIVSLLSVKQKSEMGMFGLAKRVRAKVSELENGPKPVKDKPQSWRRDVEGRLADLQERLASAEPTRASSWGACSPSMARRNSRTAALHRGLARHAWTPALRKPSGSGRIMTTSICIPSLNSGDTQ